MTRPSPLHRRVMRCRACDNASLSSVLDLGLQPLANAFLPSADAFADEERFPLELFCCDGCGLVQLVDVIDASALFSHYVYVTGTSRTMAEHNVRYASAVHEALGLGADDLVVEVASNDGSLLGCFADLGVRVLGVEPARNIAAMAQARGIPTEVVFFGRDEGRRLRSAHGAARAVIGNNVLAHVDDTVGFLAGAAALLDDDGRVIVEVPYLREMIERLEYDTIYHEHLCYFSVTALMRIAERAGLRIARVDRVPVHGGSIRVWFGLASSVGTHDAAVQSIAAEEARDGLVSSAGLRAFAEGVRATRDELLALLRRLRAEGGRVAAYGAPAKGNTLLNYCGIGTELLAFTVDRNPLKQHTFTPGMHLPVRPADAVLAEQPDYLLILAWNFADEIMAQQSEYRARGGRFILPLPRPRVL